MLVLRRKRSESLIIGNNVVVTVVDFKGETVGIGVEAPPDVVVHRFELHEAIQRENAKALKPNSSPEPEPCPLVEAARDARLWLMGSPHHLECKAGTIFELIDNLTVALKNHGKGVGHE